ncbi:hypothetical protein ACFLZJ_02145 [Nanoarchaeota archaeon]
MAEDLKFEVIKKLSDVQFKYKDLGGISKFEGSSPPSVFIGSKLKYPLMNVGILSPLEQEDNAWMFDDASYWAKENFSIHDVVKLREGLLNSRFQSKATDARLNKKFLGIAKNIAVASKPVDMEIELKNKLQVRKNKDRVITPHGMRAPLKKAKITSNVKIDQKVDKVMNDEIKASKGMEILYKNKISEYAMSKILSVGVLGLKKNKKLVPTRWSITATDDTLGKHLIERVKEYKWIENHQLFFGDFMGNYYLIMLFPNVWSYELFELYLPGSSWNPSTQIKASTDYESYAGRKTYASATAGGYYASRFPILQYLDNIKRQASVLVIRLETPSYWAALGVWVVRESVRKALKNRKLEFNDFNELLEGCRKVGMIKFGYDNSKILKKSRLLEAIQTQTNLNKWL